MRLSGRCEHCGIDVHLVWDGIDPGIPAMDRMHCPGCSGKTGAKVNLYNNAYIIAKEEGNI